MSVGKGKKKDRKGERNLSACGAGMEIIAYRNANDIDVRFDDGTVIKNKTYAAFRSGALRKDGKHGRKAVDRTGAEGVSSDGQAMVVTACRNAADIDVRFADGSVLTHCTWQDFKAGRLKSPLAPRRSRMCDRTGERGTASDGTGMEIIAYRGTDDIDIRFDDGRIASHRTYKSFRCGQVRPDTEGRSQKKPPSKTAVSRVGEKRTALNGMEMEIIAYRQSKDIDIRFADGTVVTHKNYRDFLEGCIANPNVPILNRRAAREGKTRMASCGLYMTVIRYARSTSVRVRFEDGQEKMTKWGQFREGTTGHPFLSPQQRSVFAGFSTSPAFREDGKVYYNCRCARCGMNGILTPQQMLAHEKECRGTDAPGQ